MQARRGAHYAINKKGATKQLVAPKLLQIGLQNCLQNKHYNAAKRKYAWRNVRKQL